MIAKKQPTQEELDSAKERYVELFASKDVYEVRLRNKSLAMKKGRLVGLTQNNSFAVFESKKMFVAVPVDSFGKKITAKIGDRIKDAQTVFTETGVGCDLVLDMPKSGEKKIVGLANREKIEMFVSKKVLAKK